MNETSGPPQPHPEEGPQQEAGLALRAILP
jgi:hypothetical protein